MSRVPPITFAGQSITIDSVAPGSANALVQFAGPSSVTAISQDGYELGSLQSFTIGQDGVVTGVSSNGRNRALGQLAIASFTNPMGLEKAGSSTYRQTVNSGLADRMSTRLNSSH